jgi:hypothetical protein
VEFPNGFLCRPLMLVPPPSTRTVVIITIMGRIIRMVGILLGSEHQPQYYYINEKVKKVIESSYFCSVCCTFYCKNTPQVEIGFHLLKNTGCNLACAFILSLREEMPKPESHQDIPSSLSNKRTNKQNTKRTHNNRHTSTIDEDRGIVLC